MKKINLTRGGVCYDLQTSPYRTTVDGVTYVFSSRLHTDKFLDGMKENRDLISYSLSKRFNFAINVNLIADIVLYRKIEKRGFLIISPDGTNHTSDDIVVAGGCLFAK